MSDSHYTRVTTEVTTRRSIHVTPSPPLSFVDDTDTRHLIPSFIYFDARTTFEEPLAPQPSNITAVVLRTGKGRNKRVRQTGTAIKTVLAWMADHPGWWKET